MDLISNESNFRINCIHNRLEMIDDNKLQFILKSVERSRTSVTLYERDFESMYAINSRSSEVNKLLGIVRISQSKVKAAASHYLCACVLSSFSDVSIVQEYADCCLSIDNENVLSSLRKGFPLC